MWKGEHLGLAVVSSCSSLARKQVKGELGVQEVKVCATTTNIGLNITAQTRDSVEKCDVIPCLGEKRGDLQRCEIWSNSGLGATSCTGLTCMSASFLRHCSLFLIMD